MIDSAFARFGVYMAQLDWLTDRTEYGAQKLLEKRNEY